MKLKCALIYAEEVVCFVTVNDWDYYYMQPIIHPVSYIPATPENSHLCYGELNNTAYQSFCFSKSHFVIYIHAKIRIKGTALNDGAFEAPSVKQVHSVIFPQLGT
ncbi:unnamed protein product [Trichobilharzia szidati]|nr:unnamed protein product [Trichobilharzia szidati]